MILRLLALIAALGPASSAWAADSAPPRSARATRASASPPAAKAPATTSARAAPRTLADIHIEGEVPMPQVLFVTARDQRRILESHHRRYLRTSLQLGQDTPFPSGAVVVRAPAATRREIPR